MASHGARAIVGLTIAGLISACAQSPEPAEADHGIPRGDQPAACPTTGAALQVLGSGGPIAESVGETGRAATSYLLWIDGEPRVLIDAGSGSFLRFAQAGGRLATLDAILLTHLHADHAGDLVDILNSGGFENRTDPLRVIGPAAAPRFPGTGEFLVRLLGKERGAFAYNGGYIDGSEGKTKLMPQVVETRDGKGEAVTIDLGSGISVTAQPVHHGVVPALGYRLSVGGKQIIVAGDQSAQSEAFMTAFAGAKPDILFTHHVINGEPGQPRDLHRTPQEIGELARALAPARLVLTHNMNRSLDDLERGMAAIGTSWRGEVTIAADLDCFAL